MPTKLRRPNAALAMVTALLCVVFFTGAPLPARAAQAAPDACAPDEELAYVCGAERPEDILALPGTRWLIASGFAKGAGLKLIDSAARSMEFWYKGSPDQIAPDTAAYPHCPGPPDAALLNDRGLNLRAIGRDRWRLLVVNHGGRESVEVFEINAAADRPRLLWRGCIPMPTGQVGNSVTSFADGQILATVLTRPGTTIADFVLGRDTGAVWSWRPGEPAFHEMPGTALPGNNGIESDPDERHFYTIAFGRHAVEVFDRNDPHGPVRRIVAPDFMPDNIHWTAGRLLLAGMRYDEPACGGLRKVVDGVADPMLCPRGWIVGEVDLAQGRIATIAYGTPRKDFNGLSAAAIMGRELWLGSFQAGRIAIATLPVPKPVSP